jgi:DNA-binding transcriptional ArsR family regulator
MPKQTPDAGGFDLGTLGRVDRLIHEPARLEIVAWLSVLDEADFLFLLKETGQTRGNLSSHVAKLEEAGYVAVSKTFVGKIPRTVYRLTSSGRKAFDGYKRSLLTVLSQI